jgi:hypothetical protein
MKCSACSTKKARGRFFLSRPIEVDHERLAVVGLLPILLQPCQDPRCERLEMTRPHQMLIEECQDPLVSLWFIPLRVDDGACCVKRREVDARQGNAIERDGDQLPCSHELLACDPQLFGDHLRQPLRCH